jgi:hypothetical protein
MALTSSHDMNVALFVDRSPFLVGLSSLERHRPVACRAKRKSRFLGSHKYLQTGER